MTGRLLIDTDVLIDYLRGRAEAISYLESLTEPLLISAMTVAELHAGVREGAERIALEQFLSVFNVIPVDYAIAANGGLIRRDYGKSHGVGLADAIIASTAEFRKAELVTLNKKHFPTLSNIVTPYHKG
ncbi:MAG TPA: type II toxin-antitoxin system VapC family toxin [Pyrinomonadaceae bacterium]|nr:type II toxin-antitoxin system VapC family toxin [Pyrinomonadaceae bacterium]